MIVVVGWSIFSVADKFGEPHAFVLQSVAFFPLLFVFQSAVLLQLAVCALVVHFLKFGVVSDGQLVGPC